MRSANGSEPDVVLPHHGSLSRADAARCRIAVEAWRTARRGCHRFARTRHRYRNRGPGVPDRFAAIDRGRAAAHRAIRSLGRGETERPPVRHHARRTHRMRGAGLAPFARASWSASRFRKMRSTFSRSRSWRKPRREPCEVDELFELFRSAYPYRNLPREQFDALIEMLSEGIATSRGRSGALLLLRSRQRAHQRPPRRAPGGHYFRRRDSGKRELHRRRGTRWPKTSELSMKTSRWKAWSAMSSFSGRIPGASSGSKPGEFASTDANGAAPSIPFWLGEAPGRSRELSAEVAEVRERILASVEPCPAFLDRRVRAG